MATVVSFRGVYLFSILLMIVRLGEAVPDLKIILKNRASHAGKYSGEYLFCKIVYKKSAQFS